MGARESSQCLQGLENEKAASLESAPRNACQKRRGHRRTSSASNSPPRRARSVPPLAKVCSTISRTARAIAIDEPGFRAGDFRFPDDYTEAAATTHANALLQLLADQETDSPEEKTAKAALRAKFIAFEIRADFIEVLQADLAALTERNASKHSDNQEGVLSTAAIGALLGQAQSVITRLDTIVRNKYSNHPDTLAAWKSATHVPRAPRKRDEGDDTPPPAPPVA